MTRKRPILIPPRRDDVPEAMREQKRWICYRLVERNDRPGTFTKPPFCPLTGKASGWEKPENQVDFKTAMEGLEKFKGDGVGFVFVGPENGPGVLNFIGIDLDHVLGSDGELLPGLPGKMAKEVLDLVPSYTEVSPSGDGLHIFTLGKKPEGFLSGKIKRGKPEDGILEVFWSSGYLTVTGKVWKGRCDLKACPEGVEEVLSRSTQFSGKGETGLKPSELLRTQRGEGKRPEAQPALPVTVPTSGTQFTEEEILAKVQDNPLFKGDLSNYGNDHSRADMALVEVFARFTRDEGMIDRLFRKSGLNRDKWDKPTYRNHTISKVLASYSKPATGQTSSETGELEFFEVDEKGRASLIPEKAREHFSRSGFRFKVEKDNRDWFQREGFIVDNVGFKSLYQDILRAAERKSGVGDSFRLALKYKTELREEVLASIVPELEPIPFEFDTETEAHFYFQNGFVTATASGLEVKDYRDLSSFVWKNNISSRAFIPLKKEQYSGGVFEDFVHKISGENEKDFLAMKATLGYLSHRYKDRARCFSVVLIDEEIDLEYGKARGGTGKSLLVCQAMDRIRRVESVTGSTFNPYRPFALQKLSLDTNLVFIDDIKENFDIQPLFPFITGEIDVEKKYKNLSTIPFNRAPKLVIASNYGPLKGQGESFERRIKYLTIAPFFRKFGKMDGLAAHYGHRLFDDWNRDDLRAEWNKFYNFMIQDCVIPYLRDGLTHISRDLEGGLLFNKFLVEASGGDWEKKVLAKAFLQAVEKLLKAAETSTEGEHKWERGGLTFSKAADQVRISEKDFKTVISFQLADVTEHAAKLVTSHQVMTWLEIYRDLKPDLWKRTKTEGNRFLIFRPDQRFTGNGIAEEDEADNE